MQNEVTVIQADRDAFISFGLSCGIITDNSAPAIQNGEWDKTKHLQAIASHRIAETQALADKLERAVATLDALVFDVRALIPQIIHKSVRDKIHSITNTQALKGEG